METNKVNKSDEVKIAFREYEQVFIRLNNSKMEQSNRHPLGHPDRFEHDFSESEKEHLALLRSKLHLEIANKIHNTLLESSQSSDSLGKKVFWLNIVMALLTAVMAYSAFMELSK
jgi:2-methylcitrate dehydratase PrpD